MARKNYLAKALERKGRPSTQFFSAISAPLREKNKRISRRGAEIAESELAQAFGYGLELKKNLIFRASYYELALQRENGRRTNKTARISLTGQHDSLC
jgi:hypothetical protein